MNIEQPNQVEFNIDRVAGSCGLKDGVAVQSIWVGKANEDGTSTETVWLLRSKDRNGFQLSHIKYGVVPNEFLQEQKPQELMSGVTYDVVMSGHGCGGGVKFTAK